MTGERVEWATVHAKLKRDTYAALENYCKKEGINISSLIRSLIESNVSGVVPANQAGVSRIEYNKKQDSFSWFLDFDNGPTEQIAEHLQPEFLENLINASTSAIELRKTYLRQGNSKSIPIPTRIKRLSGRQTNAKQ